MSRVGKRAIVIPEGVKVELKGKRVKASGPLGTSEMEVHPRIKVKVDEASGTISVLNESPQSRQAKQLHGTMRALIANMVAGVSKGFEKKMEVYGTGYSVKEQGGKLILQVGFGHTVQRQVPKSIKVQIQAGVTRGDDVPARFTLSGIDKCEVGQFAADLRAIKPAEPYKGKGIRYADEQVRRKVGKAFTSGTA